MTLAYYIVLASFLSFALGAALAWYFRGVRDAFTLTGQERRHFYGGPVVLRDGGRFGR